jgi:ribosomal protein S18 acetylase RimI-like enzyme
MVLAHAEDYVCEIQDDVVIACVEVKKVQWYQWEICHLSVSEAHERQGLGKQLLRQAEDKAKSSGARIVQCTIRVGNEGRANLPAKRLSRSLPLLQLENRQGGGCGLAKSTGS